MCQEDNRLHKLDPNTWLVNIYHVTRAFGMPVNINLKLTVLRFSNTIKYFQEEIKSRRTCKLSVILFSLLEESSDVTGVYRICSFDIDNVTSHLGVQLSHSHFIDIVIINRHNEEYITVVFVPGSLLRSTKQCQSSRILYGCPWIPA